MLGLLRAAKRSLNAGGIKASSRTTPRTIDEYIAAAAPDAQPILEKIRSTIHSVAPAAEEAISYQIPAFNLHGVLVYFAAFKNHIGFYPPVHGDARLAKTVARYAGDKGNLRFPLDEPIPYDLIKRIVKLVVFVASTPEFTGQPQVANGASELVGEVFGDAGRHARSAVGVPVLPLDSPNGRVQTIRPVSCSRQTIARLPGGAKMRRSPIVKGGLGGSRSASRSDVGGR